MKTRPKRDIDYNLPAEFPAALGFTNGENHVHLAIGYTEGGGNYFTGRVDPRGYVVSISAVKVADGCISFIIGGHNGFGRRYGLLPAVRFNAAILAALDAALLPQHAEIVALTLRADYDGLRALFTAACAGIGQPKAKPAPAPILTERDANGHHIVPYPVAQ